MTKTIDFNDLASGTIVDNEYQSQGVTVQAWTAGGVGDRAMIFDTANPTGGDHDLATSNLGGVLIVSEDGDSSDPDDAIGGTFRFSFADGADVQSLTFLDNEEGATVRFYNEAGDLIATRQIPTTADNGQHVEHFDVEGAYTMDVELHGSGAIDNLVFDDIEALDGTVEGTAGDDVIDTDYEGDPDGDKVDNNDAILAGDTANDDLIYGFDGNDSIAAGNGDDEVYGGTGNDVIAGGSDDDVVFGGSGNDVIYGDNDNGSGVTDFTIDWDQLGSDGSQTLTVDGQSVNVSINTPQNAQGKEWFVENGMLKNWDVTDPTTADMHFDTEISNVQFTLLDVDALDKITIMAKDADGNLVEVSFEDTGVHTVDGNMVTGSQTNAEGPGASNNGQDVSVTIAGPIQHLWIVLDNGPERDYSGTVAVTDITFEIPALPGVDGNDTLNGGDGDDVIFGNGGDDVLIGGNGADELSGDAGDDMLFGGSGDDVIKGGEGDDKVEASWGDDTIFGGAGDDDLWASGDDDLVYGGDGADSVFGGHGQDTVYGDAGNDTLSGGSDDDTVFGGEGDDVIEGDTLYKDDTGAAGNDVLFGGAGDDEIFGGAGNRDDLFGGDGNDQLFGGDGLDVIRGGAGDDEGFGGAGHSEMFMGDGNDLAVGGDSTDWLHGEAGDDTLIGGAGADMLKGGDDRDTLVADSEDTVVDGGAGGDDYDTLDLTGQGPFYLDNVVEDSNGNGIDGTVVFVDADGVPTGETIDFTEIENVVGDQINPDPDAVDDTASAAEDGLSDLGNVLVNDTDPTGDALSVTDVNGQPAGTPVAGSDGGLVTINADGTASFDANGDFEALGEGETAETTVTYTVDDGNGGTDTATVTITVTGSNDGPVATDNSYTVSADEAAGDVDGNAISEDTGAGGDSDVDDAQADLTVSEVNGDEANVGNVVAGDNGGLFTINSDGTIDFDANGDFVGLGEGETETTSVTYTITDPDGATDTATVNFTINGTNDAPIACPDLYIVSQDETTGDVDGNVITNPSDNNAGLDIDPDGDVLTVVGVNTPDGNVSTPVVGDNGGLFTVNPDGSFDFSANGEFDALAPGETAETSVSYTVSDGNGGTTTTTLTIRVNGLNDGPIAEADAVTVDEDADPSDVIANVLDNDEDPEGEDLTVGAVNGDPAGVGTPVAGSDGGLVTINPDGTVTFDPNGEFDGLGEGETATTTVTYTVTDPSGAEATETVTITVTGTNDAPDATADVYTQEQDADGSTLVGNAINDDTGAGRDSDPENDTIRIVSVTNGTDTAEVADPFGATGQSMTVAGDNGGVVTINNAGNIYFDANGEFDALGEGETAETTVTYTLSDPDGGTDTATVTITVTGTNDGPIAVADTATVDEDNDPSDVIANVLDNDEDPDGDDLSVGAVNGDETLVGQPVPGSDGGLVTINPDGTVNFDPNGEFDALAPGESAETTVTYTVTDPSGAEVTETVTITVNGVNDGPEATDNAYVVSLSETAGDVDGNVITDDTGAGVDSDPEGDALTVVAVDGEAANVGNIVAGDNGGTFTINVDGTVDFDAGDDFDDLGLGATRDSSVTYTIEDENGALDTATVTFTVTGVNDGTVQGTAGNDVINPDIPYVDADGDIVDAGDGILPGDEGTDNDVIEGFGGNDSIAAGNGDDVVFGGEGDDTVKGNLGNDVLFGGAGDDNVQGGLGNDVLDGGAGDDLLLGGEGDDTIAGGAGDDRVFGAEGDDELRGGSGNDTIEGSEGEDTLFGGTGDDDLWGGLDDDTVIGGSGNDTVAGEDGDDELHGGFGDDIIDGGAGNDVISDVEGSDTVDGGDGDDVINVGSTQGDENPDVGYPEQPSATIPGFVFPGYDADEDPNDDKDFVDGGAGNDIISTGDDDDSIIGGSGNDTIDAGFDDDTVDGGTGDDFIEGGEGNDFVEGGDGDDTIYGGLENPLADAVSFPDDEPDAAGFQDLVPENNGDELFGGAGNDTIFGQDDDDSLFGGTGDDVLDGGVDDDLLVGGDGDDVLIGGQGNDSIDGGAGEDTIFGGAGDDVVTGGEDGDVIFGGDGDDSLEGRRGDDVINGDDGDDKIVGNGGDDSLFGGAGDDEITGGEQSDYIEGGDGDDDVNATDGDDVIFGGAGDDDLEGGDGDDTIDGGEGSDLIFGGEGVDDLSGGTGSDTFFGGNGGDVVTGGEDADGSDIDVLDLTGSNVDRIDYVDGDPEAGTVTFLDGSTMTFSEIENVIPCFTPGTLIATPKGERLVEELQVGDRIITRDNGIQEIAWLGHKPMAGKQLVQNPHLQPVLIKRGALGQGLPERDMMVSPNHRVLVSSEKTQLYFEESEVLAAAKHMVGAEGIHTVNVMQTTYVHFMFERHEVVLSNGAWTESFQPGDYSLKGIGNSQRNEIFDLFPELQSKAGLEGYQSARKALKKHEAKLLLK